MSATYGYNTKPAEPKAGGLAYERLVPKADEDVKTILEPKEMV